VEVCDEDHHESTVALVEARAAVDAPGAGAVAGVWQRMVAMLAALATVQRMPNSFSLCPTTALQPASTNLGADEHARARKCL